MYKALCLYYSFTINLSVTIILNLNKATFFLSVGLILYRLNKSSHAELLKTAKADEAFSITENKTNSITVVKSYLLNFPKVVALKCSMKGTM